MTAILEPGQTVWIAAEYVDVLYKHGYPIRWEPVVFRTLVRWANEYVCLTSQEAVLLTALLSVRGKL